MNEVIALAARTSALEQENRELRALLVDVAQTWCNESVFDASEWIRVKRLVRARVEQIEGRERR